MNNPSYSHRHIWQLAWPIMLSNVTVPLVGAVDTAVMGYMDGPHFIGAIALGSLIFSMLFWAFGFLKMSTTGFVAQSHGRRDPLASRLIIWRGLIMALALGVVLLLLQQPILWLALLLIDASEKVEPLIATYYGIRVWSAPATLLVYAMSGALIGLHDTRSALLVQLVLNLSNIALNLLFVPLMGWGVQGVALASLIAEYLALAVAVMLVMRHIGSTHPAFSELLETSAMMRLIRANRDLMIRTVALLLCFSWFTVRSGHISELVLAANAILMNLMSIMAHALDGFAHATEAMGGSAFGTGNRKLLLTTIRRTTLWAGIASLLITLFFSIAGVPLIHIFTDQQTVIEQALTYLPWLIAAPVISIWCYQLDGIFIGTTQNREMRNATVAAALIYVVSEQLLTPRFGNHGLWSALMIFMIMRALTLAAYLPRLLRRSELH